MDGIIVVNKEKGYTSRDVVNIIGKTFKTKKVGHVGTLDPGANGVLVICIGKALKMSELLTMHDKEYIAGVTLGIQTDTLDMDGKILQEEDIDIPDDKIKMIVNSFIGKYNQEVPKYSAVKINGKKLYEYARNNIFVQLPKREVEIKDIKIISNITHNNGKIHFLIKCSVSKGTYIRSLVRDIGSALGTIATMSSLIRTKVGKFSIDNSYTLSNIKNGNFKILSITDVFDNIPCIKVDKDTLFKVKNGAILNKLFNNEMAFIVDDNEILIALYRNIDNKSRVYKMFV